MLTTRQIADRLGVTPRRLLQIAALRGVVGKRIGAMLFWRTDQVPRLKPKAVGRPRLAR